jgi:hypothetical protein
MAANVPAVFGLNKFLWARIKDAGILDETNYGGLIPIVPGQEVPALRQAIDEQPGVGSHPYIIYSWTTNGYDQDWFKPIDQVVYVISSTDGKKLRELLLLIIDTFKMYDESAFALNRFVHDPANNLSAEYQQYDYKSIVLIAAQASKPTSIEDESVEALVTIRVQYTNERDSTTLL